VNQADFQRAIIADLATLTHDPLGFVLYAFPWGSGELEGKDGPDEWQRGVLEDIGKGLLTSGEAIQLATASGHGVGKSALSAWIILWAMATAPDTRGIVTANTEGQLRTKTWPEVAKWHRLSVCSFMFEVTATAIYSRQDGHDKTWRIDIIPWSETNTEAFAGLHNQGRRIVLLFDEASGIPDVIWEVAEGALTDADTEILWCAWGNPTRNTGRFRECFGKLRHRWRVRQVDSRTSKLANQAQIAKWLADYGEDSDFFRIRVRGIFPRASAAQFIPLDTVEAAQTRVPARDDGAPVVMGVDVARFGDDQSVIRWRQGLNARVMEPKTYRGVDTMQLAGFVAEQAQLTNPDAIMVDGNGVGGGVVDRLRQLGMVVIEVQAAAKAREEKKFANRPAECWQRMKEWLAAGGCIDDSHELRDDLCGPEYGWDGANRLLMESKDDMKERGLASPDNGDALSLTFAEPVARRDLRVSRGQAQSHAIADYPIFG